MVWIVFQRQKIVLFGFLWQESYQLNSNSLFMYVVGIGEANSIAYSQKLVIRQLGLKLLPDHSSAKNWRSTHMMRLWLYTASVFSLINSIPLCHCLILQLHDFHETFTKVSCNNLFILSYQTVDLSESEYSDSDTKEISPDSSLKSLSPWARQICRYQWGGKFLLL